MLYYDKWAEIAQSALGTEGRLSPEGYIQILCGTFQTLVNADYVPINVKDNLENAKNAKGIQITSGFNCQALKDVFTDELAKYRVKSAKVRLQSMVDNFYGARDATERAVAASNFLPAIEEDLRNAGEESLAHMVKSGTFAGGGLKFLVDTYTRAMAQTNKPAFDDAVSQTMDKLIKPASEAQAALLARSILNEINKGFKAGGSTWTAFKPLEQFLHDNNVRILAELDRRMDIKVFFDANWTRVVELCDATNVSSGTEYTLSQILQLTPSQTSFGILKTHFTDKLNAFDYMTTKKELYAMLKEILEKPDVDDTDVLMAFRLAAKWL
jgi:hypothetical protein